MTAPAGEIVAVAVLHAGDLIMLPDHGVLVLVLILRIIRGSTITRNICLCDWQAAADPAVHGTAGLGTEDLVTRTHAGLAA